jgi:hypothetical protein
MVLQKLLDDAARTGDVRVSFDEVFDLQCQSFTLDDFRDMQRGFVREFDGDRARADRRLLYYVHAHALAVGSFNSIQRRALAKRIEELEGRSGHVRDTVPQSANALEFWGQ